MGIGGYALGLIIKHSRIRSMQMWGNFIVGNGPCEGQGKPGPDTYGFYYKKMASSYVSIVAISSPYYYINLDLN